MRSYFEPSVPSTTLVNDGSVFLLLGIWAAWTAAASDPTLPLGAALAFAAWKLYDKRSKRNPGGRLGDGVLGRLGVCKAGPALPRQIAGERRRQRDGLLAAAGRLQARALRCHYRTTHSHAHPAPPRLAPPQTAPSGAATRCGARWAPRCWPWSWAPCCRTPSSRCGRSGGSWRCGAVGCG